MASSREEGEWEKRAAGVPSALVRHERNFGDRRLKAKWASW